MAGCTSALTVHNVFFPTWTLHWVLLLGGISSLNSYSLCSLKVAFIKANLLLYPFALQIVSHWLVLMFPLKYFKQQTEYAFLIYAFPDLIFLSLFSSENPPEII